MIARYLDSDGVTIITLTGVTRLQPIKNGSELLLEHATTPTIIKSFELVDLT